jgi:hypothetical protein
VEDTNLPAFLDSNRAEPKKHDFSIPSFAVAYVAKNAGLPSPARNTPLYRRCLYLQTQLCAQEKAPLSGA